ncbi:OST-HTH/LOTUS domain-containing protein [Nocardia wallacei]|uniref:OST-HTH/LOTUS domain-containing protein n=1 Tax=Nocardia wallacei TaxID=480035 RepID=UPI002455E345|nr:OST-HTH/LOTUS domain-containing protein [Nocardia wallacei]
MLPFDARTLPAELAEAAIDVHGPHIVATRIPKLADALNAGLAASIRYATDPANRKALAVGTAMSAEIGDAWQGRLHTFLTTAKDLEKAAAQAGEHEPWPIDRLQHNTALVTLLRDAVTRVADQDGWASMAQTGSAIRELDRTFFPQSYGYPSLTRLIYATELFRTRKINHNQGAPTVYIKAKRPQGH